MVNIKNRFRNKTFLLALAAFVALMSKQFNLFELPPNYDEIVNAGLGLLVMLGIVSNPQEAVKEDIEEIADEVGEDKARDIVEEAVEEILGKEKSND